MAIPAVKVAFFGRDQGDNYVALQNSSMYYEHQYNIDWKAYTDLGQLWEAMKKAKNERSPVKLLIVDLDFVFANAPDTLQELFSRIHSYNCFKVGLSSSKKTARRDQERKKDNDEEFMTKANANKIVFKPLTIGIVGDLVKSCLEM